MDPKLWKLLSILLAIMLLFPLIASTNPLADLPSDKIKALEAGLEALRTLRLSGVDRQRLAAEE